jgi:hypothetical protein
MSQRFEYSDFPSVLSIEISGGPTVIHQMIRHKVYFTALEDGLYIGTESDMYYLKVDWKNVSRIETWLKTQRKINQ